MKKVTFTQDPKNGYQLDMKVAEDCVVIAGNFCPAVVDMNLLIQEVKATGKTKVVIVGDCHESDHHFAVYGEEVIDTLTAAGIECKWLEGGFGNTERIMPSFSHLAINTFAEAEDFRKLRNLLRKVGQRVRDIDEKIEREAKLLAEYPVVAQVQAIESHDHNFEWKAGPGVQAFNALFGKRPDKLVSEVNATVLFNLDSKTGVIVTKSQEFRFSMVRPEQFDIDAFHGTTTKETRRKGYTREGIGSIRVNVGQGSTELSIYCNPGVWTVKPHPELDVTDPDVHYVPMWKRVEDKYKK